MSHGEGLVPAVLEFLEAAIHTVLKARNVYSPALFENRKLYGITVSQCRHPGVCSYIGTVLSNLGVGLAALQVPAWPLQYMHDAVKLSCAILVRIYSFMHASCAGIIVEGHTPGGCRGVQQPRGQPSQQVFIHHSGEPW